MTEAGQPGGEVAPAPRHSAALERTELSWVRAGLSIVVTATLLIKHAIAVGGRVGLGVGVLVMLAGGAAAYVPVRRHVSSSDGGPARRGAVRATAALSVGVGVLSLAALLIPRR